MNKIWVVGFLSLITTVLYQRFVSSTRKTSDNPGRFGRSYISIKKILSYTHIKESENSAGIAVPF